MYTLNLPTVKELLRFVALMDQLVCLMDDLDLCPVLAEFSRDVRAVS